MAGHSHAKNVMHRKNAQNAKKAKIFTRYSKLIEIAVRQGGTDIEGNARLKDALKQAKRAGLPKENIERSLKKSEDKSINFEEVLYEGYALGGVAVLVEAITDNRNRTVSEVRSIFSKFGGALGESNSVAFMFQKRGIVECDIGNDTDTFFLRASELGAIDVEENIAIFPVEFFNEGEEGLEKIWTVTHSEIAYLPEHKITLKDQESFFKMIEKLEDNEDVQACWHNLDL